MRETAAVQVARVLPGSPGSLALRSVAGSRLRSKGKVSSAVGPPRDELIFLWFMAHETLSKRISFSCFVLMIWMQDAQKIAARCEKTGIWICDSDY
jgi:hypothetical protein